MRDLAINQQTIFYQTTVWVKRLINTGNPVKGYGDIESMRLCVSSNKGEPNEDIFGNDLKYDKTMSTHNLSCTIDEFTRLWIGIPKTQPYNYKVKAVAPSYSCIKYAIEKSQQK